MTGNNYPFDPDDGGKGGGVNVSSAVGSNMYTSWSGGDAEKSNGSQPSGNSGFLAAEEGITNKVYPNRNDYMDEISNSEYDETSWYRQSTGHYAYTQRVRGIYPYIMYYGAGGGGSQNNSIGNGTFSRGEGGSPGYVRVYFLQS